MHGAKIRSCLAPLRSFTVFGDVHGRVALMLTVARLWERASGEALAGILQVGDMGAFPDHAQLDDSTARFSAHDRDELGYRDFVLGGPESRRYLAEVEAPQVLWCRGNHEDFDHLARYPRPSATDRHGRLIYLPDDTFIDLEARGRARASTRVASLGGLPPRLEVRGKGRVQRDAFRLSQRRAAADARRFTLDAAERALAGVEAIDVLLSHAGPKCRELPFGSAALATLATRCRPRVHLFGHYHVVVGPCRGPGDTLLVGLEHLDFMPEDQSLRPGSCGLLSLPDPDDPELAPSFRFFTPERDLWWPQLRRHTYRALWPGWAAR